MGKNVNFEIFIIGGSFYELRRSLVLSFFSFLFSGPGRTGVLQGISIDQSSLWRRSVDEHGGEMQKFGMRATGSYRNNDAMI